MRLLDTDYWLGHCQGYRVDSPSGRVGIVDDVLFRTDLLRPDTILIRSGLFGTHLTPVPIDDVVEIAPRTEQIMLRDRPGEPQQRLGTSHFMSRLMERPLHLRLRH
jgi:hypothetical protein